MNNSVKALLAKKWKNSENNLCPGTHHFDEQFLVRITGSVEKQEDQLVAPTVSIPLVPTLALFWEKVGIRRDEAMKLLREAILEAIEDGVAENGRIQERINDVTVAMNAVRTDLINRLPKMKRAGGTITKHLRIDVTPLPALEEAVA